MAKAILVVPTGPGSARGAGGFLQANHPVARQRLRSRALHPAGTEFHQQGLRKPVNDLSRGALVEDIVFTIALTAILVKQAEGWGPP